MRLSTFNIENLTWSRSRPEAFERRLKALRPILDSLDADVLCLQEVDAQKRHKHGAREYIALDLLLSDTRYEDFHRVTSLRPGADSPADVHNLAILSRYPVRAQRQLHHDIVARWFWDPPIDGGDRASPVEICWDRPALYAALELPDRRLLHIVNLHLRAPRPAPVATVRGEGSSRAVIEGQFISALKREGQALEARLFVETLFDADPDGLIAVCGDFNADEHDTPTRLLRGGRDIDSTGPRALAALESRRRANDGASPAYTVIHAGRPTLIDHILASPALAARWRRTTILNADLQDEVTAQEPIDGSLHAPVIVEFDDAAEGASQQRQHGSVD